MIRVLVALMVFGWGTAAFAFSAEEKMAAVNKLSEARTVESYCPDLKINEVMAAESVKKYGLDLNSVEAKIQNAKKLAMAQRSVKKAGAEAWCKALIFMYGPEGMAGKGLLIKK